MDIKMEVGNRAGKPTRTQGLQCSNYKGLNPTNRLSELGRGFFCRAFR